MTASRTAALGGNIVAGSGRPLTLIGGLVSSSEALVMEVAERLVDITSRLGIQYVFKSKFRQGEPYVELLLPWTRC